MKISPIGHIAISSVYADLFSHPVTKSRFKSQKDRLLVNQLESKDRVAIFPEARIKMAKLKLEYELMKYKTRVPNLSQKPSAPPDHELQPPIGKPEQPPPIHSPFPEPPYGDPSEWCWIPEWWWWPGPPTPPPGFSPIEDGGGTIIGPPSINPSNDFIIPEDILESIKQSIADKLSVPIEDITIIDQKQVGWSDTSLGNPQPGFAYAQVIVDGYKITVQVGDDNHVSEFYVIPSFDGKQIGVVGSDQVRDQQPPMFAIPEQRHPEPIEPTHEASKTPPVTPKFRANNIP